MKKPIDAEVDKGTPTPPNLNEITATIPPPATDFSAITVDVALTMVEQSNVVKVNTAKLRELLDACKGNLSVGSGKASGENRAEKATETAMSSVLTKRGDYDSVSSALVSIFGSPDLSMNEYNVIVKMILGKLPDNTSFLMGVTADSILHDSIQVTVLLG